MTPRFFHGLPHGIRFAGWVFRADFRRNGVRRVAGVRKKLVGPISMKSCQFALRSVAAMST